MKVVAFLQNMWVRAQTLPQVAKHGPVSDQRERMIAYALFAGCITGRKLKAALGEEWCERIVWQEASPVVADNPKSYHAPEPEHIRAVLQKHNPEVVISFTAQGASSILSEIIKGDGRVLFLQCCHPASRGNLFSIQATRVRRDLETELASRSPWAMK